MTFICPANAAPLLPDAVADASCADSAHSRSDLSCCCCSIASLC
eukprot:CAMPEP_0197612534 /NCGR_PEP_ID=MMETSP1326-20131121/57481_1 /TAXON_ID=1155430 /ORGANISM="Genus nov. species nov., Strain RCC2288" /LENGTH=43 /DNA_ID= /DNA_START= /DNA_END= /DNA_ORIENTATION=